MLAQIEEFAGIHPVRKDEGAAIIGVSTSNDTKNIRTFHPSRRLDATHRLRLEASRRSRLRAAHRHRGSQQLLPCHDEKMIVIR